MPGWITACTLAVLCAAAHPASAGHNHAIDLVDSDGGCPTNQAFADALRSIFPDVAIRGEARDDLRVELVGSSDRYRVVAGTAEREFDDPEMRCDERARNAAVFVALVLEPPFVETPVIVPPPETRPFSLGVEVAGLAEAAPGGADRPTMTGGQLQVVGGGERLAAIVGVGVLPATTMMLDGVRARLVRVPIYLGARGILQRDNLAAWAEAAIATTIQTTSGLDTSSSVSQTRFSLGGRLGLGLQYRRWQYAAPFVSVHAELIPETYSLIWPGLGVVGTTPHVWLGAVIGVAVPIL